ncbi:uncharacterized protein PV09_05599 [Verruconis gallopava]|uniref:Vacuolar import and degradation protein 21 n=1 Tax=Verruconis gallopava TaxID=253628 RepID=A0A0D1YRZ2_9PEZI|nr:uncharacterized protein PV09_05599 [Verruconis gallopava]KIW03392.1 hypothetical protein PV09_05599 [Verruconis gallopava]
MSLELVRTHYASAQEEDLHATEASLAQHLRALWEVTRLVKDSVRGGSRLPELNYSAPLSPDGVRFIDNNLIARGHSFDEASLLSPFDDVAPQPTQPIQQSSLRPPSPLRSRSPLSPISNPSRGLSSQDRISPAPALLKHEAGATSNKAVAATPTPPRSPKSTPAVDESSEDPSIVPSHKILTEPSARTFESNVVRNIPSPDARKPMTTLPGPSERTSKVLHLPPKEQQEQHIREVERAQHAQRPRERKEDEQGLGYSMSSAPADVLSSPSSTAGAYSNSTPKPPQHSPDTSPDADYSPQEREPLRKASLDQLAKQGDDDDDDDAVGATPDAQLRHEEEQAAVATQSSLSDFASARDRASLDAGFAKSQLDLQTPRQPNRSRRSDNLDIDMNDAPSSTSTPMQPPSVEATQRRTTRVASGAMRQKSVSEILGESPKVSTSGDALIRRGSFASGDEREKSKHSMVVFSKCDQSISPLRNSRLEPDGYLALRGAQDDVEKDYLRPLFLHQAYQPPRASTLSDLIQSAHKTLTTMNMYANIREGFDYRILRRIYHLQNANKWAFRQMAKFPDPEPPTTHMDHLLAEMKWMRTDFREERKWKQAAARRLAKICAVYVHSDEDARSKMRVKVRIPPRGHNHDTMEGVEEPPELDHSGSTDSGDSLPDEDVIPFPAFSTIAPTALFSLEYDDIVFEMDDTPASEGILQELPMYENKPLEPSPLGSTRNSLIPVSKYTTGKLVPKPPPVIRKRSRYEYESEDDEPVSRPTSSKRRASEVSMFLSPARRSPKRREISPEANDVALFDPINRHIRDRLHANHAFRPPSEFPMPSTSFFEWRQNSQWTWDEDQKLRLAVKKFSYNWSLIAMDLQLFSQPSLFVAAQERRTPWECFERWEQLEGLPNDMDKTAYFRTYRSRIQAANRNVEGRAQAAQQLAAQNGNTLSVRRRTDTNPFRVQRRKDDRHMMMISAITKLQRKRETALHRQQESAKAAALRKQHNEANHAKTTGIHTPQEFSRMKHEREVKMQERQEAYRQQLLAQQQAKVQAMQRQMQSHGQGMPNGANPQQRTASSGSQGGPSPQSPMTNGQPQQNGVMQPRSTSQNMIQNGFNQGVPNGMSVQLPNGQMQGMNNQQRMSVQNQQDLRILMAQQRAYGIQNHGSQANNLAAAHLGQVQNPQMLAALAVQQNRQNGQNGTNGLNTSPRGQNAIAQHPQQLSSGYQPALLYHQQQVAAQFPHFTPEQVHKLANERLKGQMQRMQANALSAASGSSAPPGMNSNMMIAAQANMVNGQFGHVSNTMAGGSQSPTQYAAALQRNMQHQAAATARMGSGSPAMSNAHPVSRSATPQNPQMQQGMAIQRPSSVGMASMGDDGSPRLM